MACSLYDNDAFYFVSEGEPIKVYQKLRQDGALWQEHRLPEEGLVVNDSLNKKVFIKIKDKKLLTVYPGGFNVYLCRLGENKHIDRGAVAYGERHINNMTEIPACTEFTAQDDAEIERQIQDHLKHAEMQRKIDKLSLANYVCENDFEVMVKQDISEKLRFLADYDEDCIHLFIIAILNRINYTLPNDGDGKSRSMRNEWLMNYDYISLKLVAFPDKTITNYQCCVVNLLKLSFPFEGAAVLESPTISVSKTAREYTFDKLFQDFYPAGAPELRTALITSKIDQVRRDFFVQFPQNEVNIRWLRSALEMKFAQDFPADQRRALQEDLSKERLKNQLLASLAHFRQFYQVSNCPQYLAQWMWNVVSYVYRICAWLDTYCFKLGQGNVLMKQFTDSRQNYGFFQERLGLNQTDGFDKAISAHVREIILG